MSQMNSESAVYNKIVMKIRQNLIFFSLFFIYLIIRLLAWQRTILLEDHDSIAYLYHIKDMLSFGLQKIVSMGPDATPFYPFFGAICSLPGWSVETGARLCSLLFSLLLFFAFMGIGKQIAERSSVAIGLLILSLSPALTFLSYSVLTEPSYIAMVYLGFWLFLTQYENPSLWKSLILGIVYGLSFLNRTEGFLYLGFIPLLQGAHFVFGERKYYGLSKFIGWVIIFTLSFSILAIPQVWRVSNKMGRLAINGRQVWMAILNNPDGKSYEEKIYGLDYSPSQINLDYIQSHPEISNQFKLKKDLKYYLKVSKKILYNFRDLYEKNLGILIGQIGIFFLLFGLFALLQSGRRFESFLILAFIASNLVAPLMHNVVIRHIAVIAPIIMLTEGIGIVYLYRWLSRARERRFLVRLVIISTVFFHLMAASAYLFKGVYKPPQFNWYYGPDDLRQPVKIVQQIAKNELRRLPRICARKSFLAYFAEAEIIFVPFTTYQGLVKYCYMHDVDFLFLQHRLLSNHPFLGEFIKDSSPIDFHLLYRAKHRQKGNIELYRFQKASDI